MTRGDRHLFFMQMALICEGAYSTVSVDSVLRWVRAVLGNRIRRSFKHDFVIIGRRSDAVHTGTSLSRRSAGPNT
jgi:hypothetical protein